MQAPLALGYIIAYFFFFFLQPPQDIMTSFNFYYTKKPPLQVLSYITRSYRRSWCRNQDASIITKSHSKEWPIETISRSRTRLYLGIYFAQSQTSRVLVDTLAVALNWMCLFLYPWLTSGCLLSLVAARSLRTRQAHL